MNIRVQQNPQWWHHSIRRTGRTCFELRWKRLSISNLRNLIIYLKKFQIWMRNFICGGQFCQLQLWFFFLVVVFLSFPKENNTKFLQLSEKCVEFKTKMKPIEKIIETFKNGSNRKNIIMISSKFYYSGSPIHWRKFHLRYLLKLPFNAL